MLFKPVTHVIFDLDGLLIDSETVYDKIMTSIVAQYGKEYTSDVRLKVLGTPEQETFRIIVQELQLPITREEFYQQYKKKVKGELQNPPLLEGAERLLKHFHKHKVPFALATSDSQEATDIKLQNYQHLSSLFLHKVMGTSDPEVKNGKPSPDIFLVCASRFHDEPAPSNCLVFEDSPNGVIAAVAAGMQVVMVPSSEMSDKLKKPATLVLKSLIDFKPELFGLPPFE